MNTGGIISDICKQSREHPHSPVALLQLGVSSEEALDAIYANLGLTNPGHISHRSYKTALPIIKHVFVRSLLESWATLNNLVVVEGKQLLSDGLVFAGKPKDLNLHAHIELFSGVKAAPLETQVLLFSIYWRAYTTENA